MYTIDEQREEREIQARYDELVDACQALKPLTPDEEMGILRAYQMAKKAHAGTRRKSGEPYIFHPLAVALIAVKEVGLGPTAVICALLHDVVEDTDITVEELRVLFGDRVANIVDGVTKIEDVMVLQQTESKQAENYRKILLSMCNDAYVIFLKLSTRMLSVDSKGRIWITILLGCCSSINGQILLSDSICTGNWSKVVESLISSTNTRSDGIVTSIPTIRILSCLGNTNIGVTSIEMPRSQSLSPCDFCST